MSINQPHHPTSSDRARVLVVEDEESFIEALLVGLRREGFDVDVARDGAQALERFDAVAPDIVLLDLMIPRIGGLDVCREIRTRSQVPIIMVTARGEEIDTVVGLEVGADDYVTKPYRLRELVARMRSLLRRTTWSDGVNSATVSDEPADRIEVGDIVVDLDSHEVIVRGAVVDMPLKEFDLLGLLMENAGRVLTRDVLIDRVWGSDYFGDTKTLDVHIKRVRAKIETDPRDPTRVVTVRGVGYKFAL